MGADNKIMMGVKVSACLFKGAVGGICRDTRDETDSNFHRLGFTSVFIGLQSTSGLNYELFHDKLGSPCLTSVHFYGP